MKLLIVEDQKWPLEALELAVNEVVPAHFPYFSKESYDVARCYNDAQRRISSGEYDIVLLDHRLPYEDQGDLESIDMNRFSAGLKNIGYSLIPVIKQRNPNTFVVGTSSLSREQDGIPMPDFTMSKGWRAARKELEEILKQVKDRIL